MTGSTGYVGSRLVGELHRAGHEVVAVGRNLDKLRAVDWPEDVERVEMDVHDPDSCREALAQAGTVDVLYYLVHSVGGDDFAERDVDSATSLAAAASDAGVGRIVYLGGLVPRGEELSEHLGSRADVGEALTASGIDTVWLRASIILGAGSTSYEFVRQLVDRLRVVPLPKWMKGDIQPIAICDVLSYLLGSADGVPPGAYDIAGPDTVGYDDLVRTYAEVAGLRRTFVNVRGVTPGMAAPVVARLTNVPTEMVDDLVRSMDNSMTADDTEIRRHVAPGLTSVVDAIEESLATPVDRLGSYATTQPLHLSAADPEWAAPTAPAA